MPITVIVGGQFGSEGKGKIVSYLCKKNEYDVVVRCGGPNSGHTITYGNKQTVLQSIPAGVANERTKLLLAAGCLIDLEILFKEIKRFNLNPVRLGIDENAVIIEEWFKNEELELKERIGSTGSGTGIAVAKRALRDTGLRLAKNIPELKDYLVCTSNEVMNHHLKGKKIAIEGTQGFGLSLYHSPCYPNATSRDTIASGFLSEVGISPLEVSGIIMVIRTFPIRVAGNSGDLPHEISWEIIQEESDYPYEIREFTSVTKNLRRVARFDSTIVKQAISVNRPTEVALMGSDYLDYKNRGIKHFDELTQQTKDFIYQLEKELCIKIGFIGTGPTDEELIDRRSEQEGKIYKQEIDSGELPCEVTTAD